MDIAAYEIESEIEGSHWWFAGRRRLFAAEIERIGLHRDATILDIGTSTGTNLRMLRTLGFSNVQGLDASEEAIRFCVQKGFDTVRKGDLRNMPFASDVFDFVLATDVIEHVDNDAQAMTEIARILRPGGAALITVPTFRCLWGLQDEIAQHKRRYRKSELLALVTRSGMQIERQYYFNYLLFLPIWLGRRLIQWLGTPLKSEAEVNSPAVNRLLSLVFTADTITAPALHPPFGVSALVLARKAPRA
jgi:2-polyprenyl-3-methyl-5-hydroxy-6-metoxy-1,4-benzoquinol methylase